MSSEMLFPVVTRCDVAQLMLQVSIESRVEVTYFSEEIVAGIALATSPSPNPPQPPLVKMNHYINFDWFKANCRIVSFENEPYYWLPDYDVLVKHCTNLRFNQSRFEGNHFTLVIFRVRSTDARIKYFIFKYCTRYKYCTFVKLTCLY